MRDPSVVQTLPGGSVQLADSNGTPLPETFPVLNAVILDSRMCGSPLSSTDWDAYYAPWDVAVLTIGPGDVSGALPNVATIPVSLDVPSIARNEGLLLDEVWVVGYGANAPISFLPDGSCGQAGCGERKAGRVMQWDSEFDSCDGGFEVDCWVAPFSIHAGNNLEVSAGDSGGGLFFNVGSNVQVAGVTSGWNEHSDETRSRWAQTGNARNAEFIWTELNLPYTITLDQQVSDTAVYARRLVKINDRGHVIEPGTNFVGARVVSGEATFVGPDALAGDIWARSQVRLHDRSETGNIRTYSTILPGQDVVTGVRSQGRFMKFEDFALDVPFSSGGTSFLEIPPSGGIQTLPPGPYPDVTIRAGSNVRLTSGVYSFEGLELEPQSHVLTDTTSGPVWIYVVGHQNVVLKGTVSGIAGEVFVGIPSASRVFLYGQFSATLVAPHAFVDANMSPNATLDGSFFVDSLELHQGRFIHHFPFLHDWVPTCSNGYENCL